MAILIRNTSTFNYSWDGIYVNAGVDLDVTGWDLSGVLKNPEFIKLINDPNSGILVVDTTNVTATNGQVTGANALQALSVEPNVRTINGLNGDVLISTATLSTKTVQINGINENVVFESDLSNANSNLDINAGYF